MKKKNLTSLSLNKKSVANLATQNSVIGGFATESCEPRGICCPTHDAACPTHDCGSNAGCGTGPVETVGAEKTCDNCIPTTIVGA